MDIQSLKKYIHKNNEVEHILSALGCHKIKYNKKHKYYSAAHKDGDNPAGVIINDNEYLNYTSYSRGVKSGDCKDIVDLVQYSKKIDFVPALKWLHETLGFEFSISSKPKKIEDENKEQKELLKTFTKIEEEYGPSRYDSYDCELQAISEKELDEYVPLLHINWFREGIMPCARDKFGICYSYKHQRVVIPIRHWATGELVGMNQRTMVDNWKELGISKYFITPSYQKSLNLYGFWENKESIEKAGYVVITESEKSVLKRYSRPVVNGEQEHDGTLVALQGKVMSEEQRRIILSLNIKEVVVCLDLDVPIEDVWSICEKFYNLRKVSFMFVRKDERDGFGEKDSPCDMPNDVYKKMFDNRTEYGENMHKLYLKLLNK